MAYRIVAERGNETVRMDRSSSLMAVAKARVWASEGWEVTIIVGDGARKSLRRFKPIAGFSYA